MRRSTRLKEKEESTNGKRKSLGKEEEEEEKIPVKKRRAKKKDNVVKDEKENGKEEERMKEKTPSEDGIEMMEESIVREEENDGDIVIVDASIEERIIPEGVARILQKRDAVRVHPIAERPSLIPSLYEDEGEKSALKMRLLVTLLRLLSRSRFNEISEAETANAIANSGVEEMPGPSSQTDADEGSSSSEDEWEEMELAHPDEPGTSQDIQVHVSKKELTKGKSDWRTKLLRTEINRKVRENREDLHKATLVCHISYSSLLCRAATHEHLLPSLINTQLPTGYQSLAGHPISEKDLSKLLKWFADAFRQSPGHVALDSVASPGYRYAETRRLEKLIEEKEYETSLDAALMLFSLLHSLECIVRLCTNFNLVFPWEKGRKAEDKEMKKGGKGKKMEKGEVKEKRLLDAWVELWMPGENRWKSVDPIGGRALDDSQLESLLRNPVHYVIAVDNKRGIREVAFRFASLFLTPQFKRRRPVDEWLKDTLSLPLFRADGSRSRAEDCEWHTTVEKRAIPTTINELKHHPLYILEKDLKKYEAIYPRNTKPVGEVKKEKVFLRSNIHQLQGSINWIKFGRQIKEGEEPYKIVSKRAKVAGGEQDELPLYGYWQTEPYKVPQIGDDGRLPRNEFNNVYMYRDDMCPENTVHLTLPGMASMSRTLGLDAVAAVVGWQCQGGRNVPILDGAIVHSRDKESFLTEFKKRVKEEREKEKKKYENRVYGNWKKMIKGVMRLAKLNERFVNVKKSDEEAL